MNNFHILAKPEMIFGSDTSLSAGKRLKKIGCKKVICVYDKGVKDAGLVDKIIQAIESEGIEVVHYNGVLPDPPDTVVNEAGELGRKEKVDGIVAIGGGSSMDTAKGVNILLSNPGSITQYGINTVYNKSRTPLFMIPTTAGTGSEMTNMGVITSTTENRKTIIFGEGCTANVAILDPNLTIGLPAYPTATTGMDVLAHASEALTIKRNWNEYSAMFAVKAIELVFKYLPIAVTEGTNMEARENMMLAATYAGIAFTDATVHMAHGIGHAMGAKFHVPHGAACAIALPSVMKYVSKTDPINVKRVGKAMGLDFKDDAGSEEIGQAVADTISALNTRIGIPTLQDLNIGRDSFSDIVDLVVMDTTYFSYPIKTNKPSILAMLEEAYLRGEKRD
ncbi:MAG TPA: iron-containing alcohol dehydrogenase [Desulfosporosinus sp.]|nr:iron-containing alcohol dehydrogenase [Desulfosporosinus sp.]